MRVLRILTIALFLAACSQATPEPAASPEASSGLDWYEVYFSNPSGPAADTKRGGPDSHLAAAIDGSQESVDLAIYRLNLWSVRDALVRAHERGVVVRVITESDNFNEDEIWDLRDAGIAVRGDDRNHLMHHKFAVIDGAHVWTGSMNLTVSGAYRNDNNLIRIDLPGLASEFADEFNEMFIGDYFGELSPPHGPPLVTRPANADEVWVIFTPDDSAATRILELVNDAQHTIHVLAYNLTLDSLADALIDRAAAGVAVQGVFDSGQVKNQGSDFERMRAAGLDVRLDGSSGRMHHKVMVIDGAWVITGSYNFSRSAEEKNDENVLFIHSPELAGQFLLEFERIAARSSY